MGRSILAVVSGVVLWILLSFGTSALFLSVFPEWFDEDGTISVVTALWVMLITSSLYNVLAGYLVAYVARQQEIRHSLIFGVVQLLIGFAFILPAWALNPSWYNVLALLVILPTAVLGGYWRLVQKRP